MKRSHSYARAWVAAGALSIAGLASHPDAVGREAEGTDPRKAHVVASGPKSPRTNASKQPARPRTARPARSRLPPAARGTLRRGDATLQSGEYVDRISVRFPAGQPVQIRLASRAFDPFVIVRSPSGVELQNDDLSSSTRDAGVDVAAAEDGAYTILITSYQPGESGAYTLRYTTGEPPADVGGGAVAATDTTPNTPTPNTPTPNAPSTGTAAQATEAGELTTGDRQLRTGELYDTFERVVPAGQALRLRLESTEFDPYLMVRSPSGRQLDNDDTTPQDRNATVEVPVSEAGTYTITVTSYQPGEHGHYRLLASGGAAATSRPTTPTTPNTANTTPTPSNSGHIAAAANGGHVYGIFGGISDYPGSANDLDDCAEDAVKLAQALRRANLMTEAQQIVLTNAQMTPAAVRDAMTRMATMVGPNDIFIFFYSGHGGRNEGSSDVREIDRIDETVFLYDGEIVDDEMGRLFDGIHGRLALLTLDSCYSGGFAKDVITQPGRVGFFSSEEDVESAVASEFQAGGYLSYFLREGTAGSADSSPHDSVLTVGELEHYLIGQFAQHATNVAMEGAFQHLVVDRGAVRSDQQLWLFR